MLQGVLGEAVPLVEGIEASHSHVVLVDCRQIIEGMTIARQRYPARPLVGVIDEPDPAIIIALLGAGADGVISIAEPLSAWRECLNVVRGGARWLGGPGLHVNLEANDTSYAISKGESHEGDVTMRTRLFVRGRVADKLRG
jgi:hypothetical protein